MNPSDSELDRIRETAARLYRLAERGIAIDGARDVYGCALTVARVVPDLLDLVDRLRALECGVRILISDEGLQQGGFIRQQLNWTSKLEKMLTSGDPCKHKKALDELKNAMQDNCAESGLKPERLKRLLEIEKNAQKITSYVARNTGKENSEERRNYIQGWIDCMTLLQTGDEPVRLAT